jgi:transcriptional regulator with XRE-family HTH domain
MLAGKHKELRTLAGRLHWLRTAFDLSMEQFGFNCGIGRAYLSQLESGKRSNPSRDLIDQIVLIYGVREEWLIAGRGDPFVSPQTNKLAIRGEPLPFPPASSSEKSDIDWPPSATYGYIHTRLVALNCDYSTLQQMIQSFAESRTPAKLKADMITAIQDEIKHRALKGTLNAPAKLARTDALKLFSEASRLASTVRNITASRLAIIGKEIESALSAGDIEESREKVRALLTLMKNAAESDNSDEPKEHPSIEPK